MMQDIGIPAASIAIIENNEVVFSHQYGAKELQQHTPVTDETVFEACSLSKCFLVFVAHKLADEGRLDLDRPLYLYLDPGPALNYDPRYKLITARMILGHSSGLENWRSDNDPSRLEIISEPGKRFHYSGTAYNFLGTVIESILGQSYDQYISNMISKPLHLSATFTHFVKNDNHVVPDNYTTGYDAFDNPFPKWKNFETMPSSGISTTARDYAKMIANLFGGSQISPARIADIERPVIRTAADNSDYYYGPGFEILFTKSDTIIAHGGSNPGFKSQLFYSPRQKRGFVFFTNSNLGKMMTTRLNKLTTGLAIDEYYQQFSVDQYPSNATGLLALYKTKGYDSMLARIGRLRKEKKLQANNLNYLGKLFMERDTRLAKQLLQMNQGFFPRTPYVYCLLGDIYQQEDQFDSAYYCYTKAKALHFNLWDISHEWETSRKRVEELEAKKKNQSVIGLDPSRVEAEMYYRMKGIREEVTTDSGGGRNISYAGEGDWLDYRVHIEKAGQYIVTIRLATGTANSELQLRMGARQLNAATVSNAPGWHAWTTLSFPVSLPSGTQVLRLYIARGGFNINWMEFALQ